MIISTVTAAPGFTPDTQVTLKTDQVTADDGVTILGEILNVCALDGAYEMTIELNEAGIEAQRKAIG